MEFPRLPRFNRAHDALAMKLTDRDREIVRLVYKYRFLSSVQIVSLLGESHQQILRRLQLLYHNRYLERPRAQLEYFRRGGSHHIIYGLGNKGGALLRENGIKIRKLKWGAKNGSVGSIFFRHAVLLAEIMVECELACRRMAGVRLLTSIDLSQESGITLPQPLKWKVQVKGHLKLGVLPDAVFALRTAKNRSINLFFLEADRGTMPIIRKKLWQTSFYRKLLAYQATWRTGLHRSKFGIHRFRVLTVTTVPGRVKSMIDACSQFKTGHGLFLFCDQGNLRKADNIFTMPLLTGRKGQTSTMLP
jgi:hypothetical protein